MEVHHLVFYVSLGHMQNSMRSSVTLKLKLTLTITQTLTDTGGTVLTLMLGYRTGGELPWQTHILQDPLFFGQKSTDHHIGFSLMLTGLFIHAHNQVMQSHPKVSAWKHLRLLEDFLQAGCPSSQQC